ncbi:Efflux pump FUBT [Mycena kentingensis (nom. inval.)]|nr:Efflux pump FUBT [Mycena kentingensis (nom. inval.)]
MIGTRPAPSAPAPLAPPQSLLVAHPKKPAGTGTPHDPFIVDWARNDSENPLNFSTTKKWVITAQLAFCTWTISFSSSVYSSGLASLSRDLHVSNNVAILGISLYVAGFALGPLVCYFHCAFLLLTMPLDLRADGRNRLVFFITLGAYTLFQLQGCLTTNNIYALLSCRLLTGIFGSSPLTNAPSQIADIWSPQQRGLASAVYSIMPFLGPIIGPVLGGITTWRLNFWFMFICALLSLLSGAILTPETYAPVLLRRRANKLSKQSNNHYVSIHDRNQSAAPARNLLTAFSRPFAFLFTEPIVLLSSVYISIVYGTLYALFAAFPIVFIEHHHFTAVQGGLAFLPIGVGILLGLASTSVQNTIYRRTMETSQTGRAPPEARLHQAMVGGALVPIGLLWFAITAQPSIHWSLPIIASTLFGMGISAILQSLTTYLMDAYPLYLASAVASTVVLRSVCAAFLPQLVPLMFARLGDEVAMGVFAVLPLCMPIPFVLWRYGRLMRERSSVAFAFSQDPSETNEIENKETKMA